MSGYDPGEGWREVERPEAAMRGEVVTYRAPRGDEPRVRTWVRVPAVPPLPTEPYTVIEVTWARKKAGHGTVFALNRWGTWFNRVHHVWHEQLQEEITGFEVLAEPRAVTAKAVLEEARAYVFQAHAEDVNFDHIAREFGVQA